MIPDFASWTDHSNPEQGRPAGLLLDLERLRREYAEPELRFKRAMRGLDPDDDTSQTTTRPLSECLTMAVDREDYEMAVATCSARFDEGQQKDYHLLLLRFLVLSAWAERDCKPVILEQSIQDLSAVLRLPKSHAVYNNRSRQQLVKDRKRLKQMLGDLLAWHEFELEMIRRLSWEALALKRGVLRDALRKTVDWEAAYEAHLAADPELNGLCIGSDGVFGFPPTRSTGLKRLRTVQPAFGSQTSLASSDGSTSDTSCSAGSELLTTSMTHQYSKICSCLNVTRKFSVPLDLDPPWERTPSPNPSKSAPLETTPPSSPGKGKGKARAV